MTLSRRDFLKGGAAALLVPGALGALLQRAARGEAVGAPGFGPLVPDRAKILDLPSGFHYRMLSAGKRGDEHDPRWNQRMSGGDLVPGAHDGMAAFAGPGGRTILVRNHELDLTQFPAVDPRASRRFDAAAPGGTTTLWVRPDRTLDRDFASLSGTLRNCAGGPTPWGTWITCEESVRTPPVPGGPSAGADARLTRRHGYAFEVDPRSESLCEPVPLKAMGRFYREAVAVDPATGIVYQSEDREDGLLYRFTPRLVAERRKPPSALGRGDLRRGGALEALRIAGRPGADTSNHGDAGDSIAAGKPLRVDWVRIEDPDPAIDTLATPLGQRAAPGSTRVQGRAAGAATFSRVEGVTFHRGSVYFCATDGGRGKCGQVWRLEPVRRLLTLVVEPNDREVLDGPDNVVVSPWGDLVVCEDSEQENLVRGITPDGRIYPIARNAHGPSELAGACFSPDGATLFFNIQDPGITFAVWGPWSTRRL